MRVLRKIKSETSLTIDENHVNGVVPFKPYHFYDNIRFALMLSQVFGVMPLHNLSTNIQEVKFKWISWKTVYSLVHVLCILSMSVFCIVKLAVYGFVIDETAITCFYLSNTFAAVHFIYLAKKWEKILKEFSYVEMSMRDYATNKNAKRVNILTAIFFMFFGMIEHVLFILTNLQHSLSCKNYDKYPVEIYFGAAFPQWFTIVNYSHWAAVLVEFTNCISTFTWNFTDLFIILISLSLREKFNQISNRIKQYKNPPMKFWKEIREDYYKVSYLTKVVDVQIAGLVLISFINNIFFLCIQLYNSIKIAIKMYSFFRERQAIIDSIYFFYSFGFIVFRVVAVSLYSATLNESARKPLKYLYSLPTESYTTDVSRLITQINYLPNGITGHGFFLITKNFLLQAAATVVTFELMIFQFSPAIKSKYPSNSSTTEIICIK
ncbi:gustatory receptor for sugar taste 64e-like isoform X1 [Rhynchophorus ferrugineus]|uniref:gustatory receptor for sugar taste 64e-like isoform X1 n=1 Tax=Rhynchophorus ferrugineus TaxID=354439 RepID=UPI003FCE4B5A